MADVETTVRRKILLVIGGIIAVAIIVVLAMKLTGSNAPLLDLPANYQGNGSIGDNAMTDRSIRITDDTKHSIPLEEIVSGGPPKDGIPPIDRPQFVEVRDAGSFVEDSEPGLVYETDQTSRFYPFQILVWHEIVNDTVDGQRVLVSYCPLCRSGIVFDPVVNGQQVEFGTSGKLWNSNLLMYDRKTDSLWSQIFGEAVVGGMTGTKLAVLPSDITTFGAWKATHPSGQVLSRDTGIRRDYGRDPYGDYYTTSGTYFPLKSQDDRLGEKEMVLGLEFDGQAKAYSLSALKSAGRIEDQFDGRTIVGIYEPDGDTARLFEQSSDGQLSRLAPFTSFWFSWAAAHPDTELYQ